MEFRQGDRQFILRGIKKSKVQLMSQEKLAKALKHATQLFMLQWAPSVTETCMTSEDKESVETPTQLQSLLQLYPDLFQEPTSLPPSRGHFDHRIPLKVETSPINLRPYRYPLKQKDVIEQLVQEMQDRGVIELSSSPFASPVVFVGNKNGLWRLCGLQRTK